MEEKLKKERGRKDATDTKHITKDFEKAIIKWIYSIRIYKNETPLETRRLAK